MKPKPIVWSHSTLKLFELCPRKFHELRILKNYPKDDTEEQNYGDRFHAAAEKALVHETPLPAEFAYAQKTVDVVKRIEGDIYAELRLGATVNLEPCDFFDAHVWVRGVIDFVVVNPATRVATVGDWKTGKDRYPDREQLVLMSLLAFTKFEVDIVRSALVFVVRGSLIPFELHRDAALKHWQDYRERVARMQQAHVIDVWNPVQNFTCRKHCPCQDCEFHGQTSY
jgi:hypothetical protein